MYKSIVSFSSASTDDLDCVVGLMYKSIIFLAFGILLPQWGTAHAEIKNPSVENPKLTNVLPSILQPGVGQNMATHDGRLRPRRGFDVRKHRFIFITFVVING